MPSGAICALENSYGDLSGEQIVTQGVTESKEIDEKAILIAQAKILMVFHIPEYS